MPKFKIGPVPKRRKVDHGSAFIAVPASATRIASAEGAAAATAVSSSTDLIFEIFSRLPVKTLCRFRCASQGWHSLISDPAFVAAHKSHAEPLLVGRFSDASLRLMDMDGNVVRTIEGRHAPRMFCTSLDGLACLAFANHSVQPQVIDVATGETLLTPSNQRAQFDRRRYLPNKYDFGFGRAAVSQVYKVVRLIGCDGRSLYGCQVLTLGDGAGWRKARSPTTPARRVDYQTSVAIAGVLHFLVSNKNVVLCFDLESEEWTRTIKCPQEDMDAEYDSPLLEKTRKIIIAELNGALCIAQTDLHRDRHSCTDIWLLTDPDNNIWSKTYTIHMARAVDLVKSLRMMRDGRKLLFCYTHIATSEPVLQLYDPRVNTFRDLVVTTTGLTNIMGLCNLRLDRFI